MVNNDFLTSYSSNLPTGAVDLMWTVDFISAPEEVEVSCDRPWAREKFCLTRLNLLNISRSQFCQLVPGVGVGILPYCLWPYPATKSMLPVEPGFLSFVGRGILRWSPLVN